MQRPVARGWFRALAGVLVLLGVAIAGYELWRSDGGVLLSLFSSLTDVLVAIAAMLLMLVFAMVCVAGRIPLWLWRLYLRACGRL